MLLVPFLFRELEAMQRSLVVPGTFGSQLSDGGVVTMGLFLSGHREFRSTAYENTALYKFKKVDVEEDGPQSFPPG